MYTALTQPTRLYIGVATPRIFAHTHLNVSLLEAALYRPYQGRASQTRHHGRSEKRYADYLSVNLTLINMS